MWIYGGIMVKRDISELAIYHIYEEVTALPIDCLVDLYVKKTSEIIYIVKDKTLYGIICLKEAVHRAKNGEVQINKAFTALKGYNIIKAHEVFQGKNIHKIPVVNEKGELLGDYSRWDDLLYVKRNQESVMKPEVVKKILDSYEAVYLIKPIETKIPVFFHFVSYLDQFGICYTILDKKQVGAKLSERAICIFVDEDERKGLQCLCGAAPYMDKKNDMLLDTRWNMRMATYKSLMVQIIEEMHMKHLQMEGISYLMYQKIDEKATVLLSTLQEKGVSCFCLSENEEELTEYGRNFKNTIRKKIKLNPQIEKEQWPRREENEDFYGELYQCEDYLTEVAQKEIYEGSCNFEIKKNITGKYFNASGGKRKTCFQPEKYIGTIYLLGPCTIIGTYSEDQFTIASFLQKELLQKGYFYRVENYGDLLRPDSAIDIRLEEISRFRTNDIVVYLSRIGQVINVQGKGSLEKIFEKNEVCNSWVKDMYAHCNHKACKLIADSMLEMIESCLSKNIMDSINVNEEIKVDFHSIMQTYIQIKYLSQNFTFLSGKEYKTIGAIVMNCNPFSKGHRYLIEHASRKVEFLIVFAVEEDASLFPFEERYEMIREGVKDLDNIKVVPSGDFIASRNNFQQYFWKVENEATVCNAEYDVNIFADYIAKPLHITHRFVGEEPIDGVTQIYNEAMKRILPQKGIHVVELPRITIEDEIISASSVRKSLRDGEYDRAFAMLPDTTKFYLQKQLG